MRAALLVDIGGTATDAGAAENALVRVRPQAAKWVALHLLAAAVCCARLWGSLCRNVRCCRCSLIGGARASPCNQPFGRKVRAARLYFVVA